LKLKDLHSTKIEIKSEFDKNRNQIREKAKIKLIQYLQKATNLIPLAMLVDLEKILIFQWDGHNLSEPIICLNTADVLSHYEP
jgi:hypothetical protein